VFMIHSTHADGTWRGAEKCAGVGLAHGSGERLRGAVCAAEGIAAALVFTEEADALRFMADEGLSQEHWRIVAVRIVPWDIPCRLATSVHP